MASSLLPTLLVACLVAVAYGSYKQTGITNIWGPKRTGASGFTSTNGFLDNGMVSRVAFETNTNGISGLSVWYGSYKLDIGETLNRTASYAVDWPIIEVVVRWVDAGNGLPGRFTSLTFSLQDGSSFQLGMRVGTAREVTFTAPRGSVFGAFTGTATATSVQSLGCVWVQRVSAVTPRVSEYSPWLVAGDKVGATSFDDTEIAIRQKLSISRLAGIMGQSGISGMTVFYGDRIVSHGETSPNLSGAALNTEFIKVSGSYVFRAGLPATASYWGDMTFTGNNGLIVTIGTPIPMGTEGARTFAFAAPMGSYLGALQGYTAGRSLRQLRYVWFTKAGQVA